MRTITKKCKHCGRKFEAAVSDHKRERAKFCSLSCSTIYQHKYRSKPKSNCKCAQCGILFYRCKSRLKNSKSGIQFCSRKCKDAAQRIGGISKIWPSHYGTGNGAYSYRKKAFDKLLHRCALCHSTTYVKLYPVHHIDFDRTNNKINNLLIVCPLCHGVIHAFDSKRIKVVDPIELHLLKNLKLINKISRK